MIFFFVFVLPLLSAFSASAEVLSGGKTCSCGFYDDKTEELFTDSLIVYFNETNSLPADLVTESYAQKYEKDWNAVYRQAADPSNVRFNESESLQLFVQPPTKEHLVNGASLRTARRDIHHGSFRALIKSPRRTLRGSAMSMMWKYNETEVTELSVMNTDSSAEAWVGTFVSNEFTERHLGMNYTQLQNATAANRNYTTLDGGRSNGNIDPWDYTEYRIDWTKDYINFYIGGNMTRQILHKKNKGMPSVPSALYFKHWSTGNRFSMKGPPGRESVANVKWTRMFFNSSSMTEEARAEFVARCPLTEACSVDDPELRGATSFTEVATQKWKQEGKKSIRRMPALWVSIACLAFSSFLLIHTFIKRLAPKVLHRTAPKAAGPAAASPANTSSASTIAGESEKNPFDDTTNPISEKNPFADSTQSLGSSKSSVRSSANPSSGVPSKRTSDDDLAIEPIEPSSGAWAMSGGSTPKAGISRQTSCMFDSREPTPWNSNFNVTREELVPPMPGVDSQLTLAMPGGQARQASTDKIAMAVVTEPALGPAPRMHAHPPAKRDRIDYLAGLTAMCALVVTVMHFGLTFVPAMVIPGAAEHHRSEYWAQKIIAPFILNQMWLGVFFTTSVRFLTSSYFKTGNVENIAKAAVRRTPRLMIPVATIALLEYFLIDIGATSYLRYIPSLTWSTWPYVTRYENFGQYISEVIELVFLIPNAVPQITLHYCTGVLWTIAVQLQGSWLVLIGAIVVREIKTPSKRVALYAFCLVSHWYAQSWGAYLWLGLLLTDLDVTYKYKDYLNKRPLAYYPLLTFCWLCVGAGFAVNVIPNWSNTSFNFTTAEHDIHPDALTAEPLVNTPRAGYPEYFTPRFNGILFAGGMQAIVELSGAVQWFLSTAPFLALFPHVFTLYLVHGVVFWTWGSWLLVFLAARGFTYGVNVAVVGVTSYALLFLCLPVITPLVEALGKDVTSFVWMTAQQRSPPRRPTLFPFPKDFFTARKDGADGGVEGRDVEAGVHSGRVGSTAGVGAGAPPSISKSAPSPTPTVTATTPSSTPPPPHHSPPVYTTETEQAEHRNRTGSRFSTG
ncbi:hypothetical protein IAQ61_001889 [Plenodomus lingam]|uniref:GH16 domain-containing protein n=1 Tax=Leptosphaeria maculans (strain JN3 / isolate v23.1.3 / race Av1-4-5-6-7-8) TaxID=985895 RepID=E4ZGG9_LEPMJ|nr:hypothetical protein LEMA_P065150.1 [Plenodomus lingam JN3]KAH9878617.1 hypothetical protein IAQ61_001889 [Plenodomus lingam]CBX90389.1 hypothetical protein LEMA_P065150.1 [Plenodomus lingam JN3]